MFQRSIWMRPALQTSEAVLLPAISRVWAEPPHFLDRYAQGKAAEDPFRPIPQEGITPAGLELSTYVRRKGSMAGRGVLRAAGYTGQPFAIREKPQYYAGGLRRGGRAPSTYAGWISKQRRSGR